MPKLDTHELDRLMESRGLDTYTEVARIAKISPLTLSKARRGGNVRFKTIFAVQSALEDLPAVVPGSRLVSRA